MFYLENVQDTKIEKKFFNITSVKNITSSLFQKKKLQMKTYTIKVIIS